MDRRALITLRELGYNPDDFADCPEIALLEDWLIKLDKRNILSEAQVKALEYAELIPLEEIKNKLKEYGIEEDDIWESDESAIQRLREELRSLEVEELDLDGTLNDLRAEGERLEGIKKELEEKLKAADLKSHVIAGNCEEKWKRISLELQQLYDVFEEFRSVNQQNDDANKFQEFSKSFEKGVNEFVTQVNQYVDKTWNEINVNTNRTSQNVNNEPNVENLASTSRQSSGFEDVNNEPNVENLASTSRQSSGFEVSRNINMEKRLTCLYFNHFQLAENIGSNGILTQSHLENMLRNVSVESVDLKQWENNDEIRLNLSRKKAQLQLKVEGTLPLLKHTKSQWESWLHSSQNLLQILEKQEILQDLVQVVQVLWNKENGDFREAVEYCFSHFQEELAKVTVRITSLEEQQKKFELFYNDGLNKNNPCQQMLEKIPENYCAKELSLSDKIDFFENELKMISNNQDTLIENSKKQLSVMKERVDQMQESVNVEMEKLFEIEYGFNSAQGAINAMKEESINVLNRTCESPGKFFQRLLWVHFLTDINKLKEQLIEKPGNNSLSIMEDLFLTSTPKKDE